MALPVHYQYDIFEAKPDKIDLVECKVDSACKTLDKVRRGTYASINEARKRIVELESRLEILERNICHG
jgi:hypothetical protein